MEAHPWLVEIFRVSNHQSQQRILHVARDIPGITALGTSSGRDEFVVFESPDLPSAESVEQVIASLDDGATLVTTASAPPRPKTPGRTDIA